MSIQDFLITILLLQLFFWAVTTIVPMPDKVKQVLYVVDVVAVILMALKVFKSY